MPADRKLPYTVFNRLHGDGVPLRLSARLGEGVGAAVWERDETTSTSYDEPAHHTLSLYIEGGAGIRRRRGQAEIGSFGTGSMCLLPAGLTTRWDITGKVELFHLYIPRAALDRVIVETLGADPAKVTLRDEVYFRHSAIERMIRETILPLDWRAPEDRLAFSAAAEDILVWLASGFTDRGPRALLARGGLTPAVCRRVAEYIDAHLDQPIALADLATVAGLSTFHFARMFKRSIGESPQDHVLRRRIQHAKALIAVGRDPLADIAQACGFSGQSHFTARFRGLTGITPGQYQRAINSGASARRVA